MKKYYINLQMFADGDNNDIPIRRYEKQMAGILPAVFGATAHFRDFFAGDLEALDGISDSDTAFSVKTSDVASAFVSGSLASGGTRAYDTGANVAFGSGTGSSSRFGARTEVIYKNIDVPYTWDWTFHEGLDRHTVNADFDAAIADRLELNARAQINAFNAHHSAFISAHAAKNVASTGVDPTAQGATADGIKAEAIKIFNALSKYFVNIGAIGTKVAKVCPDLWNAIVDNGLTTTSKGSSVDIDENEVKMFKGFVLEQIPDAEFQTDEICYAYVQGIGKAFTGISTARTVASEDFDGVALQGAGKAGEWVSNDNAKAIAKVTVGV